MVPAARLWFTEGNSTDTHPISKKRSHNDYQVMRSPEELGLCWRLGGHHMMEKLSWKKWSLHCHSKEEGKPWGRGKTVSGANIWVARGYKGQGEHDSRCANTHTAGVRDSHCTQWPSEPWRSPDPSACARRCLCHGLVYFAPFSPCHQTARSVSQPWDASSPLLNYTKLLWQHMC